MIAPILSFTAEEIWSYLPHRAGDRAESVFFNTMEQSVPCDADETFIEKWNTIYAVRSDVQKALELIRAENVIGKSLEAKVTLYALSELYSVLQGMRDQLPAIFICSQVEVESAGSGEFSGELEGLSVTVSAAQGEKCERCWIYDETVGRDLEHPTLCKRCAQVLEK